jgi:hypothetical protein
MRNNRSEGEEPFYHNQKLYSRNFWHRYFWQIVALTALLIALVSTSITVLLFINSQHSPATNQETKPTKVSTQNQSLPTPATASTPISTSTNQSLPTPTPIPTTVPSLTQLNRGLTCISIPCRFKTTIMTIAFNNDTGETTLNLQTKSTTFTGSAYFLHLDFTDPSGKTFSPQGQATQRFSVSQGTQLTLTATYSFVPQPNTIYTLKTLIECDLSGSDSYQDEQFTFQK